MLYGSHLYLSTVPTTIMERKPLPAYLMFVVDRLTFLKETRPGMPGKMVVKEIRRSWATLPPDVLAKYQAAEATYRVAYYSRLGIEDPRAKRLAALI